MKLSVKSDVLKSESNISIPDPDMVSFQRRNEIANPPGISFLPKISRTMGFQDLQFGFCCVMHNSTAQTASHESSADTSRFLDIGEKNLLNAPIIPFFFFLSENFHD